MKDVGLNELRTAIAQADDRAASVSGWSIGEHVHHCCLAMLGVCRSLGKSRGSPPRTRRSLVASACFWIGRIPRGRAQAVEAVVPRPEVTTDELHELLDQCELAVAEVGQLPASAWFEHFAFGVLRRDQSLKFVRMHNRHHLRIVSDIRAAQRRVFSD